MYSAGLIASWFVNKGIEEKNYLTQMKLQKVLYITQGIYLLEFNKSLINEPIEAWRYGPVIPIIYQIYRQWGSSPITEPSKIALVQGRVQLYELDAFSDEVEEILNAAWELTKDIKGEILANWTHQAGSPWHISYANGENSVIDTKEIEKYFKATFSKKEKAATAE